VNTFINLLKISGYPSFAINLLIGLFVYFKNKQNKVNIFFCLFSFTVSFWSVGSALINSIANKDVAIWVLRLGYLFAVLLPSVYLHFIYFITGKRENKTRILLVSYGFSLILVPFVFSPFFIKGLRNINPYNFLVSDPGIVYYIFIIFFSSVTCIAFYNLFQAMRHSQGYRHIQLKYLFISHLIALFAGYEYFSSVLGIKNFPPLDDYILVLHSFLMAYAIVRYRLMDINIAITRAGIFLVIYTLVLGIPFWFGLRTSLWQYSTIIMAVLASLGPFLYLRFKKQAEELILKEQRRYQKALLDLSKGMTRIRDLDKLLRIIIASVIDVVKVKYAAIYLLDEDTKSFQLKKHQPRSVNLSSNIIPLNSELARSLYKTKKPLIGEEIDHCFKDNPFNEEISLIAPFFIEDTLLGFLILGQKPKAEIFTLDDINVFGVLANDTSLAVENCYFWQEEKKRIAEEQYQARLQGLIQHTSGMAHEILNPLQGIVGMINLIELILNQDLKNIIPSAKLFEFNDHINRARNDTKRIFDLMNSIQEFSQPTNQELRLMDLRSALEGFFAIAKPQFKYEGIKFETDIQQNLSLIRANKVGIEQVLVNFANNSIHSLKKVKEKLIHLKVYQKDKSALRIEFRDNGYGIERENIDVLFAPFVTTKASTEGKGLGLFISRSIIVEQHKGKIWAESEGKDQGATLITELPIAKNITQEERKKFEALQQETALHKKIMY
jgi:signal transduction histidine kinase